MSFRNLLLCVIGGSINSIMFGGIAALFGYFHNLPLYLKVFLLTSAIGFVIGFGLCFLHLLHATALKRKFHEQLVSNSTKYEALVNDSPIGIFRSTSSGKPLQANPSMARILGREMSEKEMLSIHGDIPTFYADPTRREVLMDILRKNGSVKGFLFEGINLFGERIWVKLDARISHYNDDGSFIIDGFITDFTNEKATQDALIESEQLFHSAFQHSNEGIFIQDQNELFVQVNKHFCNLTGYSPFDVIGKHYSILSDGDSLAEFNALNLKILAGEIDDYRLNTTVTTKSGSIVYVDVSTAAIRGDDENVIYSVTHIMDKTQETRLERDYHSIIHEMLDGFALHEVLFDKHGNPVDYRFIDVNPAFEKLTGFKREEIQGKRILEIMPGTEEEWIRIYGDVAISGIPQHFENYSSELGKFYEVKAFCPTHGYFACIFTDITENREFERCLVTARNQAEAANKAKSAFLSNISHELRTPLHGIIGMCELIKMQATNPEMETCAMEVLASAQRLTDLVDDIIDYTRLESGQLQCTHTPIAIHNLLDELHNLFMLSARKKGLALTMRMENEIPEILYGDHRHLRHILFNLIGNALKFTDVGEVLVEVFLLPQTRTTNPRLLFIISDTGMGMTEDQLEQMFDPFTQADSSFTRRYQGAGLGLSIVRELVKLMNASLCVYSALDEGSQAFLSLPLSNRQN